MNTICKKCGKEHGLFYYKRKGKAPVLGYWCDATPIVSHTRTGSIVRDHVTFIPSDVQDQDLPIKTIMTPHEARHQQGTQQYQFVMVNNQTAQSAQPSDQWIEGQIDKHKLAIAGLEDSMRKMESQKRELQRTMEKLSLKLTENRNLVLPCIGETPTIKTQ
jgi:hypothetical protein